jgi:3-deoxy-D-manno-octulosonate 8-phosphate phosphatase (KDO 8-P phosphatase)
MGNFKEDIAKVEAFVFDVDGVFTDGGIIPLADGDFIRKYYAKDGYAVAYAIKMGYKVVIISGGRGEILRKRFEHFGVEELHLDVGDKLGCLNEVIARLGLNRENVLFMGDDIPDLECMKAVGLPVAPADAAWECIDASRYVSEFAGGRGCVRDIIEQVLRARNLWAKDSQGVTCSKDAPSA